MPVASCKDVQAFLLQISSRAVTTTLPQADTDLLSQLGLVQVCTADELRQLQNDIGTIGAAQGALQQEMEQRVEVASELGREYRRDHSVLFHLHGKETQAADLDQEAKERSQLEAMGTDLTEKEQAFNQLLGRRALLDSMTPYGDQYIGLTVAGTAALRDLTLRLYRCSEVDFAAYFQGAQRIDQGLEALAAGGATYFQALSQGIPDADRAYLWAIGVGLAESRPDPASGVPAFLDAYRATSDLSGNSENRLMTSEVLLATPAPLAEELPPLTQLVRDVRGIGVPKESALGVASIVLFGRRADGSFATPSVAQFLRYTRSYESAALLGIDNVPTETLLGRFQVLRAMFSGWGYSYSEDTELSSAYLAVSENEPAQVSSKLAILSRGLQAYLEYPLVAASILGSIATLEANEALGLVEKAYAVVGRRATGLTQTELICLAVRMVHGIRNELVRGLDATAAQPPAPPRAAFGYGPAFFRMPLIVVHGGYYSTFGGVAGVHPGHVHGVPGGFGGAGIG